MRASRYLLPFCVVGVCSCGGAEPPADPALSPAPLPDKDAGPPGQARPKALTTPSHGSTVALSTDDSRLVTANLDAGTVSVFALTYAGEGPPAIQKTAEIEVGGEPTQVAIHPNGRWAFVLVRKDQKLVRIDDLDTTPKRGAEVPVGAEPTGLALEPTGGAIWVSNFVDGTLQSIATESMTARETIDLNGVLAASGYLGQGVTARPSLSHPRSIAMTNNLDLVDTDETLYVTEFYAVQKAPLAPDGSNADTSKVGLVYKIPLSTKKAQVVELPPMTDMGFRDVKNQVAGCYPNQLSNIVVQGAFGYVTSTCASPKGPLGMFTGPANATCTTDANCPGAVAGSCLNQKCTTNCTTNDQCGANGGVCNPNNVCAPNPANVRTTLAPAVSIIDLGAAKTIATVNLAREFWNWYEANGKSDDSGRRLPSQTYDIGFVPGTVTAYFPSYATDAVFRVDFDATYEKSTIEKVATSRGGFINLALAGVDPARSGRMPSGIAVANQLHPRTSPVRYAFVLNENTRNVSVIDLETQEVAGASTGNPLVVPATARPTDPKAQMIDEGKRLFITGLGRWSWKGQGWASCIGCHNDALSDNVTWFHAKGPRQPVSLDGTYASKDPTDFRINSWTAVFDEVSDHEGAIRSVAGGVGAIVKDSVVEMTSRLPYDTLGHGALNGSSYAAADPANPAGLPNACSVDDWARIAAWMKTVRSPRRPTNLDTAKVAAGATLYANAKCQGCHSGPKWTISRVFYTPDPTNALNTSLTAKSWFSTANGAGFPAGLMPATTTAMQTMRYAGTNKAGLDQLTCILRPVGTYGVAEPEVGVLEVRNDMTTLAQGNEADGKGFNPPSLLGNQLGAPYFHAGQARTLEAVLSPIFAGHHQALASGFLDANDPQRADKVGALVQYLLSIDEDAAPISIPAVGSGGGDFCTAE